MKLRRVAQGGMPLDIEPADGGFLRGTGSSPPEWTIDIESIDGNVIRLMEPAPEWLKPACKVVVID